MGAGRCLPGTVNSSSAVETSAEGAVRLGSSRSWNTARNARCSAWTIRTSRSVVVTDPRSADSADPFHSRRRRNGKKLVTIALQSSLEEYRRSQGVRAFPLSEDGLSALVARLVGSFFRPSDPDTQKGSRRSVWTHLYGRWLARLVIASGAKVLPHDEEVAVANVTVAV